MVVPEVRRSLAGRDLRRRLSVRGRTPAALPALGGLPLVWPPCPRRGCGAAVHEHDRLVETRAVVDDTVQTESVIYWAVHCDAGHVMWWTATLTDLEPATKYLRQARPRSAGVRRRVAVVVQSVRVGGGG